MQYAKSTQILQMFAFLCMITHIFYLGKCYGFANFNPSRPVGVYC